MKYPSLLVFIIIQLLCLQSCRQSNIRYSEKIDISAEAWQEDEKVIFENIEVEDGETLAIRITHRGTYIYENLYLKVEVYEDQSTIYDDVFSLSLTNDQGQWIGTSKGTNRWIEYKILERISVQEPLQVIVSQYSREPALKGIEQIELVITKP